MPFYLFRIDNHTHPIITHRQLVSIITLIKPPEAEANDENTNRGISWSQEDNDMLYRCVLYTHTDSENLFRSKEGLGGFPLVSMLVSLHDKIVLNISPLEINTFLVL